jgi:hypothetical protein
MQRGTFAQFVLYCNCLIQVSLAHYFVAAGNMYYNTECKAANTGLTTMLINSSLLIWQSKTANILDKRMIADNAHVYELVA